MLKAQTVSQDIVTLNGLILSATDSTVIQQAHIVDFKNKRGTVSDYKGQFSYTFLKESTITISAIGYQTDTIDIDNLDKSQHYFNVYLSPKTIALPDITILPFPSDRVGFRQHFMDLKIEKPQYDIALDLPRLGIVPVNPHATTSELHPNQAGIKLLTLDFYALYMRYSKEGKELAEYQRLLTQDAYKAKLAVKYNSEIVARLTGLEDENEIEKFMEYCHIADVFIEKAELYAILEKVQDCWENYQEEEE